MNNPSGNADQIAYWSGRVGESWTRNQAALDTMLLPLMDPLLKAIAARPGEAILDVGCGCGALSLALDTRVAPRGRVVGLDVSAPMLARAEARSKDANAIDWIEGDAAAYPFTGASFDKIVSRFGVMFFADPAGAFRHLQPALVRGGRLVFVCWRSPQENAWAQAPVRIAAQFVQIPPPPEGYQPGPFAFADRKLIETVLSEAGFSDIAVTPVDTILGPVGETAEEIAGFYMQIGPMSRLLADADHRTRETMTDALRAWARDEVITERFKPAAACWLVSAST